MLCVSLADQNLLIFSPDPLCTQFTFKARGKDSGFDVNYIHRMVATVFGLLIVDRRLVGLSSGQKLGERRAKFRDLLGAIPAVGDGAKIKALLKDQKAVAAYLQVEDQSFFAEDRLALLFGGDQGGKQWGSIPDHGGLALEVAPVLSFHVHMVVVNYMK